MSNYSWQQTDTIAFQWMKSALFRQSAACLLFSEAHRSRCPWGAVRLRRIGVWLAASCRFVCSDCSCIDDFCRVCSFEPFRRFFIGPRPIIWGWRDPPWSPGSSDVWCYPTAAAPSAELWQKAPIVPSWLWFESFLIWFPFESWFSWITVSSSRQRIARAWSI